MLPPDDNPSKFRVTWKPISDKLYQFFVQSFNKDLNKFVLVQSNIVVWSGGTRIPYFDNDHGVHTFHKIARYSSETDLVMTIDARDYTGELVFSEEQLSNFEGEKTEENVLERYNGI